MIAKLKTWLAKPAAQRYFIMTLFFATLSGVMTVYTAGAWWWLLLIIGWLLADEFCARGSGLSTRTRMMILSGLLLIDIVLILWTESHKL